MRIKIQDNQGVVLFVNHQDEIVHLRKEKAVGILDRRSIGYFKVGYQKMVNLAESNKVFKMYHYQQVIKRSIKSIPFKWDTHENVL